MTLEEKACQLTQLSAHHLTQTTAEDTGNVKGLKIPKRQAELVGSVLNFMTADEVRTISDLCVSRSQIPPLFMMDVIHGYRTIYPVPLALACAFDTEIVEECCEMAAIEAKYNGVQVTFAPMVDLVRDARWGRVMESAGEDPWLGGVMGAAQIRGFRRGGLLTCVKHFAAYGAVEAGSEYNTVDIGTSSLFEYYLAPYRACMAEKPDMVMSAYSLLNGVPMNAHADLLVGILRGEWGFDGVLISDYNAVYEMIVHGYSATERDCALIAASNSVDMEMVSTTYIRFLPDLVREGVISEERVDGMLLRVLRLKEKAGLFESVYGSLNEEKEREVALCAAHRDTARRAAEKSFVLLKNDGVLPLRKDASFFLCGHMAEEKDIIGNWHCNGVADDAVSVREGAENLLGRTIPAYRGCSGELDEEPNEGEISAVASKDFKTAVLCIGEKSVMSGESCSRADISVPRAQTELARRLHESGKKVVAVLFTGRPLVLTELERWCDAILCVWMPGTEGGNAIANVLFGETSPSGKLTMSFPCATGQCPIYYNCFRTSRPKPSDDYHRPLDYRAGYQDVCSSPLYPFGYGLTYTQFALSGLVLSDSVMKKNGALTVRVTLKNTGTRAGEQVVQLYLRDHHASVVRPVKQLKAYKKLSLSAGESAEIQFELTDEMLGFYNGENEFLVEDGKFSVMVGTDSRDLLSADFERVS